MRSEQHVVGFSSELCHHGAHLREMSVLITDRVSPEILRDFGEQQIRARRVPSAGYAARGRDVDGSAPRHTAFDEEGSHSQQNGGRIAPWVRYDRGAGNLWPHELRQAVRGLALAASWSEVRGKIDHTRSGAASVTDPLRRGTMWQRGEDEFRPSEWSILSRDVRDFSVPDPRLFSPLLVRRGEREVESGVLCDQSAQFPSCVPTRSKDAYWNFMHGECITLHSAPVNDPVSVLAKPGTRC